MTIHVVLGPPCSGKSTFVNSNVPTGVFRFDFEAVAATTVGLPGEEVTASKDITELVLAMRRGLVGYLLDGETSPPDVWMITQSPTQGTIDRFAAAGAVFHVCDPGEAECLARAERSGADQSVIDAIKAWYVSPPNIPESKGGECMKLKDISVSLKALGDEDHDDGVFEAYASVFDTVDSYGDMVVQGAFADTLAEWESSGSTIPVMYKHDFEDPFSNIGAVETIYEDGHGLRVKARLDLDNPKAAQVYRLMKAKRLCQMSFAFDVERGAWVNDEDAEYYRIEKVKLYEVSVVPIGANQETEILAVKAARLSHSPSDEKHTPPAKCDQTHNSDVQHTNVALEMALALLPQ